MISRAARTLGPMRLPSSWPSCIVRDTRDILTLNGGNVFNVGIVHRQQIFKDHFLIIDDRFLNFFWAAPERYIMDFTFSCYDEFSVAYNLQNLY